MIEDGLESKLDYIITKSVKRFIINYICLFDYLFISS